MIPCRCRIWHLLAAPARSGTSHTHRCYSATQLHCVHILMYTATRIAATEPHSCTVCTYSCTLSHALLLQRHTAALCAHTHVHCIDMHLHRCTSQRLHALRLSWCNRGPSCGHCAGTAPWPPRVDIVVLHSTATCGCNLGCTSTSSQPRVSWRTVCCQVPHICIR